MSKKYVPSGYQIINIDIGGKVQGNTWEPRNEDEEILLNHIKNEVQKPLLVSIHYGIGNSFIRGFAVVTPTSISIGSTDNNQYGLYIQLSVTANNKIELTNLLEP